MLVIVGILAVIIFGYLVVNLLIPKFNTFEKLVLGYLIGFGLFTLALFIANTKGVPYALNRSSLILAVLIIIGCLANFVSRKTKYLQISVSFSYLKKKTNQLSHLEKTVVLLLVLLVFFSLLNNLYWPVKDWDSLVLYDFRAKTFILTGFMDEAISLGYFFNYPLLTSLSHTWVYLLGGENPMFLFTLYYLSLLVCFYYALVNNGVRRSISLFFTLLLASSNLIFRHSNSAYTNLPYTTLLFTGIVYAYQYIKENNIKLMILSGILTGLSIWTRTAEPFWMGIVVLVFLFALYKRKIVHAILYPMIIYLVRTPWMTFVVKNNDGKAFTSEKYIAPVVGGILREFSIERVLEVTNYLWINIVEKYFVLLGLFILSLMFIPEIIRKKHFEKLFLVLVTMLLFVMVFIGTFVMSYSMEAWNKIGDSAYRMVMFIVPLILFSTAIQTQNFKETTLGLK